MDLTTIMAARLARVDVPKDEAMVQIAIDSTTSGLCLFGHRVEHGKQTLRVYESEVAEFEKYVEHAADDLRAAERHHRENLELIEATQKNELPFIPSVEASFRLLFRRDPRPLRSLEVVKPKTESKSSKAA